MLKQVIIFLSTVLIIFIISKFNFLNRKFKYPIVGGLFGFLYAEAFPSMFHQLTGLINMSNPFVWLGISHFIEVLIFILIGVFIGLWVKKKKDKNKLVRKKFKIYKLILWISSMGIALLFLLGILTVIISSSKNSEGGMVGLLFFYPIVVFIFTWLIGIVFYYFRK